MAKKKTKKRVVNLKTVNQLIDKKIADLTRIQEWVSDAVGADIDLRIGHLKDAKKAVKSACKNAKMTPGFSSN